jgi:hypothetical protein
MEFRVLISLVILLTFTSCVKDVNIDIPGYESRLVIDGRIETGQPPFILLSKTQDIYAPTSIETYLNSFQSGAVITVSDGTNSIVLDEICSDNLPPGTEEVAAAIFGISISELENYHLCGYTTFNPLFFGQVGKTYTISIAFEGKTYTSETKIVAPVPLDQTHWKQDEDAPDGYGFAWAKLSDPGGVFNAYFWEARRINLMNGQEKDARFERTFNPTFNDEFIDGTTFDFAYENPKAFNDPDLPQGARGKYKLFDSVIIKFSTMDEKSFEFLEKKFIQLQSTGNPFATPTVIPSHFSNGALGSWIGYSPSFDTLVCIP